MIKKSKKTKSRSLFLKVILKITNRIGHFRLLGSIAILKSRRIYADEKIDKNSKINEMRTNENDIREKAFRNALAFWQVKR